jgi:hypothetical protein
MDPAEAKALAGQVSAVVGAAIAGVVAASAAGAAPPGPGAMAVIGQVQVLSQIGRVGGGGGAMGAFSSGFDWANGNLPVSMFAAGNEPAPSSEKTGGRRWVDTARRAFRRGKKGNPLPGQTSSEASCEGVPEDERKACKEASECGFIDGIPMLDKMILVVLSLFCVFLCRSAAQLFVTRCMKKDPWDALTFPQWEGPLLLVHWFGMCDALATTLGRPCSIWIVLSCAIIFFGPICFLLFSFWQIARNVRKGLMVYEESERVTWKETREKMSTAKGCMEKLKHLKDFYHARRHRGEWVLESKESKTWDFLIKDFSTTAWKFFAWLLLRKLLLAVVMGLTVGAFNSSCVVILQTLDVTVHLFMNPFSDNTVQWSETFSSVSNLINMILAAMPTLYGGVPDALGDLVLIYMALLSTVVAVVQATLEPIFSAFGAMTGAVVTCMACLPGPPLTGVNVESFTAGAAGGSLLAAVGSIRDSVQEMVEDGIEEMAEAAVDGDVDAGDAAIVGATVAGVAAVAYSANKQLSGTLEQIEAHDAPVNVILTLALDYSTVGNERSVERTGFEEQLIQDLADASGVFPSRFQVKNMSPGSIIVDINILPDSSGAGPSAASVMLNLQEQATDDKSVLRNRSVTMHAVSICCNELCLSPGTNNVSLSPRTGTLDGQELSSTTEKCIQNSPVKTVGSIPRSVVWKVEQSGGGTPMKTDGNAPSPVVFSRSPPNRPLPDLPIALTDTAPLEHLSRMEEWASSYARRQCLLSVVCEWRQCALGRSSRMNERISELASRKCCANSFSVWYSLADDRRARRIGANVFKRRNAKRRDHRMLIASVKAWKLSLSTFSPLRVDLVRSRMSHYVRIMSFMNISSRNKTTLILKDALTKWLLETKYLTDDGNSSGDDAMSTDLRIYFPSLLKKSDMTSPRRHVHVSSPTQTLQVTSNGMALSRLSPNGLRNVENFSKRSKESGFESARSHARDHMLWDKSHPDHASSFTARSRSRRYDDDGSTNSLQKTFKATPRDPAPRSIFGAEDRGCQNPEDLPSDHMTVWPDFKSESSWSQTSSTHTAERTIGIDTDTLAKSGTQQKGLFNDLIGAALIGPEFLEQKLIRLSRNRPLGDLVYDLEQGTEPQATKVSHGVLSEGFTESDCNV